MFGLGMCHHCNALGSDYTAAAFLLIALCCGLGFGLAFPSFNALFINLGTNAQRGTATSTYLTTWDLGLGIGIFSGGLLAEHFSFSAAYLVASASVLVSLIFFVVIVTPHYHRNKLR
jgi:predicted MFS family arabinose efflux permease